MPYFRMCGNSGNDEPREMTISITLGVECTAYSGYGEAGVNSVEGSGNFVMKNIRVSKYKNTGSSNQTIVYGGNTYTVSSGSTKTFSSLTSHDFELRGSCSNNTYGEVDKHASTIKTGQLTIILPEES